MERLNITWFPPLWRQALNFVQTGFLVNNAEFMRTCQFYYDDITFEEAYQMTRKHVCISVSRRASGGSGSGGPTKLLLNHISTPHVLIRSAVAASCALPGIMRPHDLLTKTADGEIVPFHVDGEGVQFIDGSVQADVPFRRMSALFSVSNFIVSQVNIHVLPFIEHKIPGALPSGSVLLKDMLSALDLDLRHRSVILSKMGLMPKLYGHDISSVFKQVYHGNVTIVPQMKVEESLGVKAIMHPSKEDMRAYIRGGRKASWPHLRRVKHLLCLEASLWTILESLVGDQNKTIDFFIPASSSAVAVAVAVATGSRDSDSKDTSLPPPPPLYSQQSVSNLVMYTTESISRPVPPITKKQQLSSHSRGSSTNDSRRSKRASPRLLALRKQTMKEHIFEDTFDNFEEFEHDGQSKDVYDEDAIAYMLQRITDLEKENSMLKHGTGEGAYYEQGNDGGDNDKEATSEQDSAPTTECRKRRLSACLEPI
jgi:hypothetical protein